MTAQDRLNRSARAHGWANWSEVLMHNAPAHVINLIVEEAMRGDVEIDSIETYVNKNYFDIRASEEKLCLMAKEYKPKEENGKSDFYLGWRLCFEWVSGRDAKNREPKPALTWRPGARVRITGNSIDHGFAFGEEAIVDQAIDNIGGWICSRLDKSDWWILNESDAVVVG